MSDSPLSRQDIYAAAAAHDELGPEYSDAVVASFLEKVEKEIDARVDARLAGRRQPLVHRGWGDQACRRGLLRAAQLPWRQTGR
jgi:hypothetical protein